VVVFVVGFAFPIRDYPRSSAVRFCRFRSVLSVSISG